MNKFYMLLEGKLILGVGKIIPEGYSSDFSVLTEREDGSFEEFYLDEIVDGKYVIDTVKKEEAQKVIDDALTKEAKDKALAELVVESNTVPFDANDQSINYMSSVLAVANFKYNQAIGAGADVVTTYTAIYKTIIQWKNADNTISDVQLETVAEALEQAMNEVGSIKTGG